MARKLKSDKVLFIATLLLVGLSVVMVYSASAPWRWSAISGRTWFLTKQAMWAALGIALLGVVMRVDYRTTAAGVHLDHALAALRWRSSPCCSAPPVNNARRWFGVGGTRHAAVRARQAGGDLLHRRTLERRMHRIDEVGYSLLPIGIVVGGVGRADSARARLRHVDVARADRRGDGLRRRAELPLPLRRCSCCALPAIDIVVMGSAYRRRRMLAFLNPWDDPLGDGFQIIQSLIAVGTGGVLGQRADERRAEAVLSAGAAHRLHLLGDLRGARADRRHRRA